MDTSLYFLCSFYKILSLASISKLWDVCVFHADPSNCFSNLRFSLSKLSKVFHDKANGPPINTIKKGFFSQMDVIFVWTWECPQGYDGSQRTTTFHQTKSCHIYLSFADQHFLDLYCCFKYIEIDINVQKIVSHVNGKPSTKIPTQKCPIFFSISKRNGFKLKKSHWITLSYIN